MNILLNILLLLGVYSGFSSPLSCVDCKQETCTEVTCLGLKVKDQCGCCDICAKQAGESCGGPWDSEGTCDTGLACMTTDPDPIVDKGLSHMLFLTMPYDQSMGICSAAFKDCNHACEKTRTNDNHPAGFSFYGRESLFVDENSGRGYSAYCDCSSGKGRAWTVIQRRSGSEISFDRTWAEYEKGFGSPMQDFWIGLDKLHKMTQRQPYELEISIQFKKAYKTTTNFGIMIVGSRENSYQLILGLAIGKLSNEFVKIHSGMKFSTKDSDNDNWSGGNCAKWFGGGWWFNRCTSQNLNGIFYTDSPGPDRITWGGCKSPEVEMVEMKIRPLVY